MTNDNAMNTLIDEAFINAQKDLHVIHFFTALNAKSTLADSVKAVKAMQKIYGDVMAGKKDYEKLAAEASDAAVKIKAIGYWIYHCLFCTIRV